MKVTISDVAKLAGVSTATVSHTINNTRYVSNETKEKVYRAIAELGYTPDASARSFRTGKKKIIGFIVPDIANKFFATMIESVEDYLSANGYQLIIANTRENMEREETNIRLLTAGLVDGLLVASTMDDFQRFDSLIPAGFPVVLVDRIFNTKKYSSVCVSNFQPIYRSVCRLAGKGDRRIGITGGLPRLSSTKERISAYRQAMADCGLPEDEDLIQYGDSLENSACACLDELLASAHISKSYFLRLFRQYMGTTPYNFLLCYRITKAKELLAQTDLPVGAVAHQVGFGDESNFSTRFTAMVGQSPLRYRKSALRAR